jgi:hypothetical protein
MGTNEMIAPITCTMSKLYFSGVVTTTGTSAQTATITLYHGTGNATPTASALTCTTNTLAASAADGTVASCSDLSHTVSIAAGDKIAIDITETGTTNKPTIYFSSHMQCQ